MESLHVSYENVAALSGCISFLHAEGETACRAFSAEEPCSVLVKFPRMLGVVSCVFDAFDEGETTVITTSCGRYRSFDTDFDTFVFSFSNLPVGLYFCRLRCTTAVGTLFGRISRNRICFEKQESAPDLQITVSKFAYPAPPLAGGILYHIFVDRFAKSGKTELKPGCLYNENWENGLPEYPPYPGAPLKNNVFFGGDLWGIADRLDYIFDLGVSILYLSPIFESPSNHKYDTSDYLKVDSMFGGEAALSHLLEEAKKRGMFVILDGVFNHTGADSIYFNKFGHFPSVGACQSKDSPYYPWFDFQKYPDTYTCWWNIPILPRICPDEPSCRAFFVGEQGMIAKYAKLGVLGFRLDVADELSDDFIASVKSALEKVHSPSMLYGEVWEDASNKIAYGMRKKYYLGRELDGVMNYPLRNGLLSYFADQKEEPLRYYFDEVLPNMPPRVLSVQMNILGTHDTERILTALAGPKRGDRSNDELAVAKLTQEERTHGILLLQMAYTVLATLPGIPSIYYGDEAGLEGYSDPFNRKPFPWGKEEKSLLSFYQRMGRWRRSHPVYENGAFHLISLDKTNIIFSRTHENKAYVTVVNNNDLPLTLSSQAHFCTWQSSDKVTSLSLPPYSATVLWMDKGQTLSYS